MRHSKAWSGGGGGEMIAFIDGAQGMGRMYRWQLIGRESKVKTNQSRVHFQSTSYCISFQCCPHIFIPTLWWQEVGSNIIHEAQGVSGMHYESE